MKTFEQIAIKTFGERVWSLMGKEQKKEILSAMREACEQVIDECASEVDVCSVVETLAIKQSILNLKQKLK